MILCQYGCEKEAQYRLKNRNLNKKGDIILPFLIFFYFLLRAKTPSRPENRRNNDGGIGVFETTNP